MEALNSMRPSKCIRPYLVKRIGKNNKSRSTGNYKDLFYSVLRYSLGVFPVCFLKAVLKDDFELKPTS